MSDASAENSPLKPRSQLKRSSVQWWAWLGLLLPLVGILECGLQHYHSQRAPRFAEYAALRDPVAQLKQPGDVLVVSPHWAEPMVRQALGEGGFPVREAAHPGFGDGVDASRTVVEVSVLGERAAALQEWHEQGRADVGPFNVRRLVRELPSAPDAPAYDFVSALSPSATQVSWAGKRCPWTENARLASGGLGGHPTFPKKRFQCPGGAFFHVGITAIADQRFRARRCLWAHPPKSGELRIRFANVPLKQRIAGHGGMYWVTERERKGAPVAMRVLLNDEVIGRYVHQDGDGWSAFAFPLTDAQRAEPGVVEFAISSSNNRHRHFCFEARTL